MPKTSLDQFLIDIQARFPNLKAFDETRLFSVLLQAGVNVEFEVDPDGQSMVMYEEIGPEAQKRLLEL